MEEAVPRGRGEVPDQLLQSEPAGGLGEAPGHGHVLHPPGTERAVRQVLPSLHEPRGVDRAGSAHLALRAGAKVPGELHEGHQPVV